MDYDAFRSLLAMSDSEFQAKVDEYLRNSYEQEAKDGVIEQIVQDIGIEEEIVRIILEHNGVDWS